MVLIYVPTEQVNALKYPRYKLILIILINF